MCVYVAASAYEHVGVTRPCVFVKGFFDRAAILLFQNSVPLSPVFRSVLKKSRKQRAGYFQPHLKPVGCARVTNLATGHEESVMVEVEVPLVATECNCFFVLFFSSFSECLETSMK